MLNDIAMRLLQNQFICKFTQADLFNEIHHENEIVKTELERFLAVIGRSLQLSAGGTTYFVVHTADSPGAKEEARKAFELLREKIRPTLSFLQLMAQITHQEGESSVFIQGGEILSVPEVISGIEQNQAHTNSLDRLVWVKKKDDPLTVKVRSLFKELEKEGLLALRNQKTERYVVTGKTDVMMDALEFIVEAEGIASKEPSLLVDPKQQGFDI